MPSPLGGREGVGRSPEARGWPGEWAPKSYPVRHDARLFACKRPTVLPAIFCSVKAVVALTRPYTRGGPAPILIARSNRVTFVAVL